MKSGGANAVEAQDLPKTKAEGREQQCYHSAWPVYKPRASSALGLLVKLLFSLKNTGMMKLLKNEIIKNTKSLIHMEVYSNNNTHIIAQM